MSPISTFMAGFPFLPVLIISITVTSIYALLRKHKSFFLRSVCTWPPVNIFNNYLVFIEHIIKLVVSALGVVTLYIFNKPYIYFSVSLTNEGTYQVLLLVYLFDDYFLFWVKNFISCSNFFPVNLSTIAW